MYFPKPKSLIDFISSEHATLPTMTHALIQHISQCCCHCLDVDGFHWQWPGSFRTEIIGGISTSYLDFGLWFRTLFDFACDLDLLNWLDIHPFIQHFVLVDEKSSVIPRDVRRCACMVTRKLMNIQTYNCQKVSIKKKTLWRCKYTAVGKARIKIFN